MSPSSVHPSLLIAVLAAAGISVSLMQTLIIPLLPELPKLLDSSASDASWAITATLLTAAVATPVFGRLGDVYGPKPMLVTCALMLIAGSLIAATTSSLVPLVVGRGLQGFGIPIIPLGISVLRTCVPAERVGSAMGLMSASLGVGGALGLPLSAVIAQHYDWHMLFWFATALGVLALAMFTFLVPHVPSRSTDRLDPLGALLLAGGLVTLLLGISKGQTWGWTSGPTLAMFGSSAVILAVFVWWQLRVASPTVDLRTTMRRPVLATNVASIAVAFGMFGLSLVAPQILEMSIDTGYGLGQSMLATGLWMAPGGLAMMVTSPIAARIAAVRGPRFTLVIGAAVISASYAAGLFLLAAPWQVMVLNVLVSVGVGFAYASMPALIIAAVPVSETAAANGINALARSLGTSISSAVIGAILAGMTVSLAGRDVPSMAGFRTALVVAAVVAALAAVLALLIPVTRAEVEAAESWEPSDPGTASSLILLGRHSDAEAIDTASLDGHSNLVMRRIDEAGSLSLHQLATATGLDVPTAGRHVTDLLRHGLASGTGRVQPGGSPVFYLTPRGFERLHRLRDTNHDEAQGWSAFDVEALSAYADRLAVSIDADHGRVGGAAPPVAQP
ncbi:MFS transporter [Mycolicibacterium sediminis]|uniref:MFS transporter n=2 Tax=Mycolicibacterium sediminis TaxID=1286180 RepID=A0A7I7QYR6_9MYCO|nr:MFS transporter [Mycolicibacterium sediminis]